MNKSCVVCGETIKEDDGIFDDYIIQYVGDSTSTVIQFGLMCKTCNKLPRTDRKIVVDPNTNRITRPVKKTKSKKKKLEEK